MGDDDLDLELELDEENEEPAEPKPKAATPAPKPEPAPVAKAPVPAAPKPATSVPPTEGPEKPANVMSARKPGLAARAFAPVSGAVHKLRLPTWNLRNFLLGLAVLILVVLVVENWPSTRLSFLGLHADVPKAVVLILDFALGFVLAWLLLRRKSSPSDSGES